MPKLRAVAIALGLVSSFAFAASTVSADPVHNIEILRSLNAIENMSLHLPDVSRAEEHSALFAGVRTNHGKHSGFSVAAVRPGVRFGLVKGAQPTVTENPEPATMLLLGTGLAAVGAAMRGRKQRQGR
ncbi:MAG: PEP-CTERM sorting domain-containing protein [Acidobacteria bacterium]|nr:PEP-CTERM sorting domain-containing protein [Acidobacteriota bacterium]